MEELLKEALVPKKEQPYEVPENWVWTKLPFLFEIKMGQSPKGEYTTKDSGYTPLVGGPADMGEVYPKVSRYTKKVTKLSNDGELIVSIRATIGKTNIADGEYCLGRGVASIKSKVISARLLMQYFSTIESYLNDISTGTTFRQISRKGIETIPFPLSPLNEQKRIANKVERLLNKIDEAKQLIEEAKGSFELRRAAILDKAFRGELTTTCLVNSSSNEHPYSLPEGWNWEEFDNIAKVCSNLVNPNDYLNYPHIAPDNIEKFTGRLLEYKTIEEARVKSSKHLFKRNHILYSKIRPYLSKVTLVDFEGLCSADMYPIETNINTEYLYFYMLSPYFIEKASTAGSRSVLPKINKKELGKILVPVPSDEKQTEVVKFIKLALSKEIEAISYIQTATDSIELLKQSILSKAFKGQMGTNDPSEENAVELLTEVLQEKL
ncbi:restriction endonuclease subunit S [Oceanobacillus neutriphilus]|nr:restriction endonuclease subunit S [Oceanobacillus neutriphilus]